MTGARPSGARPNGPLGWLLKLVVSEEDLREAPESDRNTACIFGILVGGVFAFYTMVMCLFLVGVLGSTIPAYLGSFFGAAICATLLASFDLLLTRAAWVPQGMKALRRVAAIDVIGSPGRWGGEQWLDALSQLLRLSLRVGVSVVGASVYALMVVLLIAKSAVVDEQVKLYKHSNERLYALVTAQFDQRVATEQGALDAEKAHLAALEEEAQTQRAIVVGKTASDTEAARLQADIVETQAKVKAAEADMARYGHLMTCEVAGESDGRDCEGASGVPGPYQRYRAYVEHRKTAEGQLASLKSQLDDSRARLAQLQNVSATRLSQLDQKEVTARQNIRALETAVEELHSKRTAEIDSTVKASEPPPSGPMAEIQALYSLADKNRAVKILWTQIDVFVTLLELSVVFAALTINARLTFPIRMAVRYTKVSLEGAADIINDVKARRGPDPDPPQVEGSPPVPGPVVPGGSFPAESADQRPGEPPAWTASAKRLPRVDQQVVADAPAASEPVAAGPVVSIPFMITKAMRQKLRARGYSQEQIGAMTPAQAYDALR